MMNEQKQKIQLMRHQGQSYKQIAQALDISENTIKSYCRRNSVIKQNIDVHNSKAIEAKEIYKYCKQCEKSIEQNKKGQRKKFCSEECRRKWWKANEDKLSKKAYYTLICSMCKRAFESYGNKNRRFCSHNCYINMRFNKGSDFMTSKQFEGERNYRISLTIAKSMLLKKLITEQEYSKIDKMLISKYKSIIGGL